jgi:hypothetical protein
LASIHVEVAVLSYSGAKRNLIRTAVGPHFMNPKQATPLNLLKTGRTEWCELKFDAQLAVATSATCLKMLHKPLPAIASA